MSKALDLRHPFFIPLWRRVVLVAVMAFWVVVELRVGHPMWALLVGGIGAYAAYVFFFDFNLPDNDEDDR